MLFFVFKQKTAYEMRISDWSSDVCSSDLDSLAEMAAGADVVMHIAGVVNVPTRAAFEAGNATATANVVDAARNAGITRFVHVSSLAARAPALSNSVWSTERSEERRGGKECGRTCRFWRPPYDSKTQ